MHHSNWKPIFRIDFTTRSLKKNLKLINFPFLTPGLALGPSILMLAGKKCQKWILQPRKPVLELVNFSSFSTPPRFIFSIFMLAESQCQNWIFYNHENLRNNSRIKPANLFLASSAAPLGASIFMFAENQCWKFIIWPRKYKK